MVPLSNKPDFTAPGAIVVEWNVAQPSGHSGGAGMWDSHIRLGGGKGRSTFEPPILLDRLDQLLERTCKIHSARQTEVGTLIRALRHS